MSDVEIKNVVITNLTIRGEGVTGDPMRRVLEVWDTQGNKIAENDPCNPDGSLKPDLEPMRFSQRYGVCDQHSGPHMQGSLPMPCVDWQPLGKA